MLTHIVVWKYKPDTSAETKAQHIAHLRALVAVIPEIINLAVGADILHLSRSYDTGLVAQFENRAALERYDAHLQHKQAAAMGREISEHVASVDFESDE